MDNDEKNNYPPYAYVLAAIGVLALFAGTSGSLDAKAIWIGFITLTAMWLLGKFWNSREKSKH